MKWKLSAAAVLGVVCLAVPGTALAISDLEPSGALTLNRAGDTNGCYAEWQTWEATQYNWGCQRSWDHIRVTQQIRNVAGDFRVLDLVKSYTVVAGPGQLGAGGLLSHCVSSPDWPAGRTFAHRLKVTVWDDNGSKYRATVDTLVHHSHC